MTDQSDDIFTIPRRPKRPIKVPRINPKLSRGLQILILVVVLLLVAYNLLFVYVHPNEFGIKVVRIGINRGVQKEILHRPVFIW